MVFNSNNEGSFSMKLIVLQHAGIVNVLISSWIYAIVIKQEMNINLDCIFFVFILHCPGQIYVVT